MKDRKSIILSREMIHAGKSCAGGWNKKQLAVLGVDWPPEKGWVDRLKDTLIFEDDYNYFLELNPKRIGLKKTTNVRHFNSGKKILRVKRKTPYDDYKFSKENPNPNWSK